MARINIEDTIFTDLRFINLIQKCGNFKVALGEFVWAVKVAQKHYLNESSRRAVPLTDWKQQGCSDFILEVGLASETEFGISLSGSEKQFGWLVQKSKAGKVLSPKKTKQLQQAREKKKEIKNSERDRTGLNGSEALSSLLFSPSSLLNPLVSVLPTHEEKGVSDKNKIGEGIKVPIPKSFDWSATQLHQASYQPEAAEFKTLVDKNKFWGLKNHIPRLVLCFGTTESLSEYVQSLTFGKGFPKEIGAQKKYIEVSIKRVLGVLEEKKVSNV